MTRKMWLGFSGVLDLLWRTPNAYIDTSYLHMRDTIELLTAEFGARRVLFGIGAKAHYGAAIAALVHARIDETERALIAHGNAERILKLAPYEGPELPAPDSDGQKPLWHRFRSGRALENVEVIDAHGHTPPHTRGWIIRENTIEGGMAELVTRMDRLGVSRLILSPEAALFGESLAGNREAEQTLAKYRGRISGYLVFNPLYAEEMIPEFDAFFSREFFVGFKLLPSYWKRPLSDRGYEPVWRYANARRLPILIHTWDDRYNSPAMLEGIAAEHPEAVFILGHSGGGTAGRLEAESLAQAHANVYLEFCGTFTTPRPFETSLRLVGRDRVLFGSDTAAHDQAWELGRYLSMPLPDEELLPGLGENMRRLLAAAGRQ
ncbi:MAG: amidohydrolase family protein [Thermoguttaceae bacterium]|nr:amidohydrolase family protein [Thermoguttaceae bacterium]